MTKPTTYTNVYSTKDFIRLYKNVNVRIQKAVDEKLQIFGKNPFDLGFRNHPLHDEWEGCRSIDITSDYRAVYEEIREGEEMNAYFIALGTHEELYG